MNSFIFKNSVIYSFTLCANPIYGVFVIIPNTFLFLFIVNSIHIIFYETCLPYIKNLKIFYSSSHADAIVNKYHILNNYYIDSSSK